MQKASHVYLQLGMLSAQKAWDLWDVASLMSSLLQNGFWRKWLGGTQRELALLGTVPNVGTLERPRNSLGIGQQILAASNQIRGSQQCRRHDVVGQKL